MFLIVKIVRHVPEKPEKQHRVILREMFYYYKAVYDSVKR